MKSSIRTRLFFGTFSLVVFFVVLSWALNNGCLTKFYLAQKGNQLVKNYRKIDRIYHGDPQRISLDLEKIARTSGMFIRIFNSEREEKYNSFPKPSGSKNGERQPAPPPPKNNGNAPKDYKPNKHLQRIQSRLEGLQVGKYKVGIINEPRLDMTFLNLAVKLENGDYLWLETAVWEIEESARIANKFFLFTGLLVLLAGSLMAYGYAKRFSRPILELNGIARRIAKLDFSRKYHGGSSEKGDELDELGKSINILSDELGQLIRELQESNRKLAEENERKQKIDEMRKEFISNVSHELKTPIALIQGYAEGLIQNIMDNEADKEYYCNVIMDEAIKMNSLVRKLLDLSQIESGYSELEMEEFDLSELVEGVLEKYRLRFKEEHVEIRVEKNGSSLVRADYFRIEQVIYNYLDNALHHIDKRKALRISITDQAGKIRVAVYNSGKPIPQEYVEAIWQSFYKTDKARTRAYGGSGLGLSIVKAIMELHHNECGVVNHSDGVEFWFELDSVPAKAISAEVS